MITENLSTLKIHKLTQAQYDRELEAGRIDANALYLTPDEGVDLSGYATKDEVSTTYETKTDSSAKLEESKTYTDEQIDATKEYIDTVANGKANADHTHENADGGFAGGTNTSATGGAALGNAATAQGGGAVGKNASTSVGGATGMYATSGWGGAVGWSATATDGFSGGNNAKSSVNSIQLGAGTNTEEHSLQVYSNQLMNGDGYIPAARLVSHSETITGELSGVTYYEHLIEKTWSGGIPIVRSVNWTVDESTYAAAHVIFTVVDDDFNNLLKIGVQRPSGVNTSTDVSYCLQVDILGI